jgi:hypothetical protein
MRVARDGSWYQLSWNDLLWAQAVTLAALCGILRLSGVTLRNTSNATAHATETGEPERSLQFGIRDVLVGTTALAILLGLAKAGDLLTAQFLKTSYSAGLLFLALIATSTAAVLLLALWASLGQGSTVFRLLLLLLIPPTIGLPIGTYCIHIQPMLKVLGLLPPDRLNHWYGTGYWWIGWMFLAGTLLASLLLIFRVPGYRLVWQRWKHFAPRSN